LISTKDFGPLNMHYMKAHSIVPSPPLGYDAVPLQLDVLTPVVQAGDWAVIEVSLGSSAYPVDDLLGMNFTLEIGSRFVDSSSVQFTLAEDGIFNPTNSVIAFAKSPKDGIIDVGIGKVDKEPIHGHGVVGQIKFIVEEDLNGFRSLDELFRKKLVGKRIGILGSKDLYALEDTEVYVTIRRDQLTTDDIQIYPNPASDWVTLPSNVRSGNLVNAYGQLVKDLSSADLQMDVSNLPSGTYILELLLDNDKKIRKRLEIVR
ncbi:MAG: T9SS type A sorting domain-containing protein, partial [Saprospiraceae bacterium]|nr:T9SS type A sorting domain-containing protein [Saprospiraceae bacterium]